MKSSVAKPVAKHTFRYKRVPADPILVQNKKWGRIWDAVHLSGINKTTLYELLNSGEVESFIFKHRPDATTGSRLINLESLNAYLDRRAEQAKAEAQAKLMNFRRRQSPKQEAVMA